MTFSVEGDTVTGAAFAGLSARLAGRPSPAVADCQAASDKTTLTTYSSFILGLGSPLKCSIPCHSNPEHQDMQSDRRFPSKDSPPFFIVHGDVRNHFPFSAAFSFE
jgi:hypothetical protein